ncbi:MAG TPA: phosphohistidine phosphatase SixA [Oculatellaceae cyanobacterium]
MKIYLVRHGIATERIGGAVLNDSMRPLTDEGRQEAKAVAQGLKRINVKPNFFVSSPLVRAKQTAEIFAEVLNDDSEVKICDALAPGGSPASLYKFLRDLGNFQEVMLFGHEPDIGMLAATLLDAAHELQLPFKKAGVCRVDVYDLPPSTPGILKWFITPKIATVLSKS